MPVEHLRAADRHPTPWRNGGGVTREVVSTDFSRVSLAEIAADGPFSAFPDQQRILTVLSGEGIELTIGDAPPVVVPPLQPFAFPGGAATACRLLGGPVTALNLITRHPDPAITLHPPATLHPAPGRPHLAIDLTTLDATLITHPSTTPTPTPAGPCAVLTL
ncbi:environmental stress-induced protein Ves [Kitasatospora sp. GP30]|uniref:HutD/Ves family protein n=1 Tax=Kitasatospora sp. GP30 TaxID=3035084 RepID=UPI000C70FB8E|nr:HutD family protein [Kitasatospora sp. GP30]MDH6143867.1 environmental stress-induced protein Ves [Kitasatospora sp. GP30]